MKRHSAGFEATKQETLLYRVATVENNIHFWKAGSFT